MFEFVFAQMAQTKVKSGCKFDSLGTNTIKKAVCRRSDEASNSFLENRKTATIA